MSSRDIDPDELISATVDEFLPELREHMVKPGYRVRKDSVAPFRVPYPIEDGDYMVAGAVREQSPERGYDGKPFEDIVAMFLTDGTGDVHPIEAPHESAIKAYFNSQDNKMTHFYVDERLLDPHYQSDIVERDQELDPVHQSIDSSVTIT